MDDKRVKLGIDIGELSNQLVQINNTIEQNYQRAIQGQTEYNKILEESIDLLQKQVDLVGQMGQQNQVISNNPVIGGTQPIDNDKASKTNDLLEDIFTNVESIWEKFSSLATPIPVEVVNTPLLVQLEDNGGTSGGATASGAAAGGAAGAAAGGTSTTSSDGNGGSNRNALGTASNIAASSISDPNYLIAGLAGMIPVVGAGIASVLSKMIGEAEQRVKAEAVFQGATGGNLNFMSLHNLGYKNAEAYQKEAQYYPANINLDFKDLQFEKGYGVGGGTMDSLLRAMREDVIQEKFGTSSAELGVTYLTQLRGQGQIDSQKVRGYTEEYLKILIDLNQKQLETTGETNSLINSEVVANIAKTSEKFGDPTVLQRVIQGIQGGLMQAPSAQAEALQYWAMSQANPEADIWQMQLMRENPFGAESRGYFANYLNSLMQTGNQNDVRFNVMSAFGLTAHQTEELLNGINNAKIEAENKGETFNLTDYLEGWSDLKNLGKNPNDTFITDAGAQINREANRATAANEVLLAQAADRLADVGEPILKFTNLAIEKTGEVIENFKNFLSGGSLENSIVGALDKFYSKHPNVKNLGASEYTETQEEKNKSLKGGYKQNLINPNTNISMHWRM